MVLGGSSGIGKATAIRFAMEGWQVMVVALNIDECTAVVDQLDGERHVAYEVDVRNYAGLEKLAEKVKEVFGEFDVLVNCVGISECTPIIDSDFSDWDNSVQVMMYGAVNACKLLVPLLKDNGRIVQLTSIHYCRVAHGSSAYGMAKAAITQFTRSLAIELAPRNILANTIAPGFVNTPMSIKADGKNELDSLWFKSNYIDAGRLPLKRAATPAEIAGVAWFLAGPDASYITGSVLTVDGGLTITF